MTNAILVINTGSSSVKFACYVEDNPTKKLRLIHRGAIGNIGAQAYFSLAYQNGQPVGHAAQRRPVEASQHEQALVILFNWLETEAGDLHFVAAGHRVVHGADWFNGPVPVDAALLDKLQQLIPLARLHQPYNLAGIRALQALRPGMLQVACFDTAFHQTQPAIARMFALPRELTESGIKRYGFHGLSYEHIANILPEYLGNRADARVVVAHLGNGASMCAMKQRKSQASTMGLTVLDGLPMGTRCGALDPGVILHLLSERRMPVSEVVDLLYHKSGLLGVSGLSGDMQELLHSPSAHAAQAIQLFVYRIGCELGSLAAALGGLDALIFTGGIGEHAAEIRVDIGQQAQWLGIEIDIVANAGGGPNISTPNSPVAVWVLPANEELVIAHHTLSMMATA